MTGLADRGHQITILSLEKPERLRAEAVTVREICRGAGIRWHSLQYHKQPPILSSVFDLCVMRRTASFLHRSRPFDLVHCRSYMAALVGHSLKTKFGVPFLFDMRGFWIDERVEMGLWPLGNPFYAAVHSAFRPRERQFLHDADAIVSLTERARTEMATWVDGRSIAERTTVIPCCVDLVHFSAGSQEARRKARNLLNLPDKASVLVYVGSLGGNHLLEEMLDLFQQYKKLHSAVRFLFITYCPAREIVRAAHSRGVPADDLVIRSAPREEVPLLIAAGDLGVAFKRPTYSSLACSPTKIGEMLAVGIPVIANAGVGDTAEILRETGAGAVVEKFDQETLANAVREAENAQLTPEKVRAMMSGRFALDRGVEAYDAIYRRLGSPECASQKNANSA